mmetsp:Transcript_28810/g.90812  ORF Transcript_28810/g.90812 Transcript_28810/m.90812 type:complete len:274 (+) Transcript_28810:2-823(+)
MHARAPPSSPCASSNAGRAPAAAPAELAAGLGRRRRTARVACSSQHRAGGGPLAEPQPRQTQEGEGAVAGGHAPREVQRRQHAHRRLPVLRHEEVVQVVLGHDVRSLQHLAVRRHLARHVRAPAVVQPRGHRAVGGRARGDGLKRAAGCDQAVHALLVDHDGGVLTGGEEAAQGAVDGVAGPASWDDLERLHDHHAGGLVCKGQGHLKVGAEAAKASRDVQGGEDTEPRPTEALDDQVVVHPPRLSSTQHEGGGIHQGHCWQHNEVGWDGRRL